MPALFVRAWRHHHVATTPQLGTPLDVAVPDWSSERCIVIGVAGGSGSGKSTIAAKAAASDPAITVIKQDACYRHLTVADL